MARRSLSLFLLNRDVHDVALAIHEQEREIGGFEWIGEALMIHIPIPRDSLIVKRLRPRWGARRLRHVTRLRHSYRPRHTACMPYSRSTL